MAEHSPLRSLRAEECLEDQIPDTTDVPAYNSQELMNDLDRLTEGQLVERIKLVENWSYELGCKEEQEMQRGERLGILEPKK